jgi:type II secretory pathway pseudopilin PulG
MNSRASTSAFTLVEVLVSMMVFVVAFSGLFIAYYQSTRTLTVLRQTSRANDIALANIEFLRTRTWDQLTNVYVTTGATTPSHFTSNLTESIHQVVTLNTNSPVCTHLELLASDPLNIGLLNARRDFVFSPNPAIAPVTANVITSTVLISWETLGNRRLTNGMTTVIAKQGLSAD